MKKGFDYLVNVKAFLKNAIGGFLIATSFGADPKIAALISLFCGLSGSYTDIDGFIRNKTQDTNPKEDNNDGR